MNNCIEYLELISAHADDELTESDRTRVEEHLSGCENCSALLELYREISAASIDSCLPAPEALCSGVMAKIQSGEADGDNSESGASSFESRSADSTAVVGNAKKNNVVRMVMTRYLPMAACLALVLISLPRVISNRSGGGQTNQQIPAPMMAEISMESAPAAMMDAPPEVGGGMAGGGDTASSRNAGGFSGFGSDISGAPAPAPSPSAMPQPDSFVEIVIAEDEIGLVKDAFVDEPESPEATGYAEDNDASDSGSISATPAEVEEILREFKDAYAWIEIRGKLPEQLAGYESEPLGEGYQFEVFYKIPSSVAQVIIDEIYVSQGLAILVSNSDSEYAIVLYSHED